jgi:hypothetical protein
VNKQRARAVAAVVFVAAFGFAGLVEPAFLARRAAAKPTFMDRYDRDAYSKAELRGRCTVCHIGHGGGERNDFGEAFEDAGFRITPRLRRKFPDKFVQGSAETGGEKEK